MSMNDIVHSLAGWNLSVSNEQLQRPTTDFVEAVYTDCLRRLTEIDESALRDPVQNALLSSTVDDKDLYGSALTSNLLVYHLSNFACAARVDGFSGRDISNPERDRTIHILSGFINFIKFTEQFCQEFIKDVRDRADTIVLERERLSDRLAAIQKDIDMLKTQIARDEPRCEELRMDNDNVRANLFATKEIQTSVVKDVENLKADKTVLISRKEALNAEITSVSDTMARTRSRIVQSPERIKRTISVMSSTAIEEKKIVVMNETKARDLQTKMNALINIEKDLRGCLEQLQTIEKESHSLSSCKKELSDLRDHLDVKKIEENELKLRQERVAKQYLNAQDKLERAQRHADDKKMASQRTLERLQREYDEMVMERRDNDKQVEELKEEAHEVDKKMNEHLRICEEELSELLGEYWRLRHEADVYMETLANKLNMRVISE